MSAARRPSWPARHWQRLLAGGLWGALLASYALVGIRTGLSPLDALRALVAFLRDNPYGPLVFVAAYALRPLVLFSAGLLTVAAGALFGPLWGVLYTVIGANLGAALAYGLGALLGGDLLAGASPNDAAEGGADAGPAPGGRWRRYLDGLRSNTFATVLLLRTLYAPYDLVNYLAGFGRVPFAPFLLATALGSLPGTVSFALLGAATGLSSWPPDFDPRVLAASLALLVASLLLSRWLKRRERRRERPPGPPASGDRAEPV